MDDQRDLSVFVRRLHGENNSKDKVIGSRLCYYSFKFNLTIISKELYEGHLHLSFDPHGVPINAVFVKVDQADAKKIFQRTSAINDGIVLKPWTYVFSRQKKKLFGDLHKKADLKKGIWTLCYDHFEHTLEDWTNLAKPQPKAKGIAYNDNLKLPIKTGDDRRLNEFWRKSIRELIDGLGRIHSKGLYHGGLGSESNYVFIGECLKVINIKGDLDEFNTDEDRENKKKEDITDLLGMLDNWFESILAGGKRSWLECQHFFDFVNRAKTLNLDYDVFVKKVACHPFLLEADGRMSLFVEYDRRRNAPTTRQQVAVALTSSSDFANFKSWNSTSTVNNMDSYMRGVYNHRNYSGDVEDLLRYLRNLHHHYHEHGLAAGSMEIVDRGVTTYFRGFLEVLYKNLEI